MKSLNVLIEKYTAQIKELETRMAETSRKLAIISEACRLLVEEGLSEEVWPNRPDEDETDLEASSDASAKSEAPNVSEEVWPNRPDEDETDLEASSDASVKSEAPNVIQSRHASVLRLAESLRGKK